MAETINISRMAEILSNEVFAEFLWQRTGPTNTNWECQKQDAHNVKTHPSDVVFFYDEPYSTTRTYINCDLKSYSKASIKPQAIKSAMESLAMQVECAEVSEEWQRLYTHSNVTANIFGLLFVYNHDGEFDKDFNDLISKAKLETIQVPKGTRLYLIGPDDIFWLNNVRYEIAMMRSRGQLPSKEHCRYYYPQLVRHVNAQHETARAATMEMLTSPWIVLEHGSVGGSDRGVVVFHRRPPSVESFTYLIAYLRQYQLLDEVPQLRVRGLAGFKDAAALFSKAVQEYLDKFSELNADSQFAKKLGAIEYASMSQVVPVFSDIEIGME